MSTVAAIQMASAPQADANLFEAGRLIQLAKEQGAELIVLPENFAIMGMEETDKVKIREKYGDGPIQAFLRDQARKHNVWLVGGTIPLECDDPNKILAACVLYNSDGEAVARERLGSKAISSDPFVMANRLYVQSDGGQRGAYVIVEDRPQRSQPDISDES